MLTGKCKEDFEMEYISYLEDFDFYLQPLFMQWGLLIDFFDGKGYYLSTYGLVLSKTYCFDISCKKNVEHYGESFKTLKEAQKACIEKSNQLYNLAQKKPKTNAS